MNLDKPNCKKYQHFLDQCHIPYDTRCYDWNVLYNLLENAANRFPEDQKYSTESLVEAIKKEIFG